MFVESSFFYKCIQEKLIEVVQDSISKKSIYEFIVSRFIQFKLKINVLLFLISQFCCILKVSNDFETLIMYKYYIFYFH